MFEKVNPGHPDKVADRIAGAIIDEAYNKNENPHIAVEILLGHGNCYIILESDIKINNEKIKEIVKRIADIDNVVIDFNNQDVNLNSNQKQGLKCGDNGIFKPVIITPEQRELVNIAGKLYRKIPYDGKYLINNDIVTICQSNTYKDNIYRTAPELKYFNIVNINPLGYWTGGPDVDSGATNRKLGSDMGDGITGGGLHGKDLSKADVTMNICAYLDKKEYMCSIGDEYIDGIPYYKYVERAREYIESIGGFEKFAEWGLIRPDKNIVE